VVSRENPSLHSHGVEFPRAKLVNSPQVRQSEPCEESRHSLHSISKHLQLSPSERIQPSEHLGSHSLHYCDDSSKNVSNPQVHSPGIRKLLSSNGGHVADGPLIWMLWMYTDRKVSKSLVRPN
jgi:hypothetical protein